MFTLAFYLIRLLRALWVGFRNHEFRNLLFTVITLLVSGTIFYHGVEGWKPLDALYFSVTTLTTVGLGDFAPKTDTGKIFTIVYIFVGLGIILGFVDLVAHHTKNQNPFRFLRKRVRKRGRKR